MVVARFSGAENVILAIIMSGWSVRVLTKCQ